VIELIDAVRRPVGRTLVAIAGAPGSGKSTLAADLVRAVKRRDGPSGAVLLPMDGFHLENDILAERGMLSIKGAPETFDLTGFLSLVEKVRHDRVPLTFPLFDRALDRTIPNAGRLPRDVPLVVCEGNYLLLKDGGWAELRPYFDATIMLSVSLEVLRERLVERWLNHGLTPEAAVVRADGNDMVNARTVLEQSGPADLTLDFTTLPLGLGVHSQRRRSC
jgi:pantothenate kinase